MILKQTNKKLSYSTITKKKKEKKTFYTDGVAWKKNAICTTFYGFEGIICGARRRLHIQ